MNEQITIDEVVKIDFSTITEQQMSELATRISRVTDKELYHSLLYAIIDNKYAYLSDGAEQNRIAANPNDSVILSNNNVHKFFTKNEQFINDLVKLLPKIQE